MEQGESHHHHTLTGSSRFLRVSSRRRPFPSAARRRRSGLSAIDVSFGTPCRRFIEMVRLAADLRVKGKFERNSSLDLPAD
jgi:hypothetical protein